MGCRGGFYGIVSKVLFLLGCFFPFYHSLLLTVQHLTTPASPVIPRDVEIFSMPILSPAHLQELMGSEATWAGSSGLDGTAVQPQILCKRPGGEGEILLQPGRSVPCPP